VSSSQQRMLGVLACLMLLNAGQAPSIRQLAEALKVRKSTAWKRLHWIEKKGLWSGATRSLTETGLLSAKTGLVSALDELLTR